MLRSTLSMGKCQWHIVSSCVPAALYFVDHQQMGLFVYNHQIGLLIALWCVNPDFRFIHLISIGQ